MLATDVFPRCVRRKSGSCQPVAPLGLTQSIAVIREIMDGPMVPMTLSGIKTGMKAFGGQFDRNPESAHTPPLLRCLNLVEFMDRALTEIVTETISATFSSAILRRSFSRK